MTVAELVEAGSDALETNPERAEMLLHEALRRDPTNAPALFDLGLLAKQRRDWPLSIKYFRSLSTVIDDLIASDPDVDVGDERPEWWNIGIAATALHDWALAREAWNA